MACPLRVVVLYIFLEHVVFCHERDNPLTIMVRKTVVGTARKCMTQVNATESDLEYLREEPPFPEKSACIVKCLLDKIGIVKNNKFSKSGFLSIITPLVIRNKKKMDHMKSVAESCNNEIRNKEDKPCELGNEITGCIFKYAPELHFTSKKNSEN